MRRELKLFCLADNADSIEHTFIGNWVGVCGLLPKTLNLSMTKTCDFPYLVYDLTKNLLLDSLWEGLLLLA